MSNSPRTPFSLYIHIPYCYHKCPYCDFNTYAVAEVPQKHYSQALCAEIDYQAFLPEWKDRPVQTIYFGGGTPSILEVRYIKNILSTVSDSFEVLPNCEITLESNPHDLGYDYLSAIFEIGINRLSIGAQSYQSHILKTLGRSHTKDQIQSAIVNAKQTSFKNISVDLIIGVSGQSLNDLQNDIDHVLDSEIPHVSIYILTIEKGTPFYQSYKKGILNKINEDTLIDMITLVQTNLELANLNRYEISNFSIPSFESRHNLAYWNGDDYLGVGAGAHSFCIDRRWANYALPQKYISCATASGQSISWSEQLTLESRMFEYFLLGLRKIDGVSLENFEDKFNLPAETVYGDIIQILVKEGFLEYDRNFIKLSSKGLNIADSVIENFSNPKLKRVKYVFSKNS